MDSLARWFYDRPIRYKLTLAVMGLCFVALTVANISLVVVQYLHTQLELHEEMEATAKLIEQASQAALDFEDKQSADEAVSLLRFQNDVSYACLYDADHHLFTHYAANADEPCPAINPGTIEKAWDRLVKKQEIGERAQPLGTLFIIYSLRQVYFSLIYIALAGFIILLVVLLLSYWATRFIERLIANPITQLADAARELSSTGNYSIRLEKKSSDEVGVMVDNFNRMLERIEQHDASIREEKQKVELLNNELILANQEADIARRTAERTNYLKSEFLANMSHELRTPMHAILGFSRRSIKKIDTLSQNQLLENLQLINESGDRLLGLLNDLLDLSKLEAGKMNFDIAPTDLQQSMEKMLREIQSLAHDKQVEIELESPNFPTTVECDGLRIGQVILNMLSNAIKFTPPGKSIYLSFSETEIAKNKPVMRKAICFTVADEGTGIPEGELEMVFDKFAQSSKTKSGAGGTGLGLAICKEIIRAHSGRIWAEHGEKGGAIFKFAIPCIQKKTHIEAEIV
jgi:signal transduction histidine kinase